jgi:hypothetical protein
MAGMDLADALVHMNAPALVRGRSDANLVAAVQLEVDALIAADATNGIRRQAKQVTPAGGVGSGLTVRPIDALLRLARATRPLISDDVYDWYKHWGWLRYLGIFDWHSPGVLGLSPAGLAVRANQRRVLSEDLGVGFGCLVAEAWCSHLGAVGPITIVDVDLALREGRTWLHGARLSVGDRQPDYLLIYPQVGSARAFTFKALECKGTSQIANANGQLARAVTQLASIELSGVVPQGIGVSTVSSAGGVKFLAVDPEDDRGLDSVVVSDQDLARVREPAEARRSSQGSFQVDAGGFIAASLLMGAGTLADFGGNNEAAAAFLPPQTNSRLSRRSRNRVVRETADGLFRGVEHTFSAPDGSPLRIFMGIAEDVDRALTTGELDQVGFAQRNFSAERPELPANDSPGVVSALADDGAILMLRAES